MMQENFPQSPISVQFDLDDIISTQVTNAAVINTRKTSNALACELLTSLQLANDVDLVECCSVLPSSTQVTNTLAALTSETSNALACELLTSLQLANVVNLNEVVGGCGERVLRRSQRKRKADNLAEDEDATNQILKVLFTEKKKYLAQFYDKNLKSQWSWFKAADLDHIQIAYHGGPVKSITQVAKENVGVVILAPTGAKEPQQFTPKEQGFCTRDALAFFVGVELVKNIPPWTSLASAIGLLGGRPYLKITTHLGKALDPRFNNFIDVVTIGNYVIEMELTSGSKHCFALTVTESEKFCFDPNNGITYSVKKSFSEIGGKYVRNGYYIK
jgi:hypothetical protein